MRGFEVLALDYEKAGRYGEGHFWARSLTARMTISTNLFVGERLRRVEMVLANVVVNLVVVLFFIKGNQQLNIAVMLG